MLISLHLPKTAGLSFSTALNEFYGSSFKRDYADLPINTPTLKRNSHALKMCFLNRVHQHKGMYKDIECIHGHFLPLKYLLCKNVKFITWMRDPVERMASHYFYWIRNFNPEKAPPLHRKVIEEKWSLERFCLAPELRNFYSQFLWGFPFNRFDFVGILEHYDTELEYFSRNFLGVPLQVYNKNINPDNKKDSYFEDRALREKIQQYHGKDMALFNKALNIRQKRRCAL